jgi:hypothetical protein
LQNYVKSFWLYYYDVHGAFIDWASIFAEFTNASNFYGEASDSDIETGTTTDTDTSDSRICMKKQLHRSRKFPESHWSPCY